MDRPVLHTTVHFRLEPVKYFYSYLNSFRTPKPFLLSGNTYVEFSVGKIIASIPKTKNDKNFIFAQILASSLDDLDMSVGQKVGNSYCIMTSYGTMKF